MILNDVDLSRAVSRALRHEPWLYELELDEGGWVPVDRLLGALRRMDGHVLISVPLDDRPDWHSAADDLSGFLERYLEALGDKYWERSTR